jgi:HK97 family phage major capsid protein
MPIAVSNAMPAGSFLVGDFQRAIEIAEYTPLTIQISEDTTDKKKNQVTVIAEEELIVPIYNPYWFVYGTFAAAITALEKP